jgi:hypothetical protein
MIASGISSDSHTEIEAEEELDEIIPMRTIAITAGRSAEIDNMVAAIAMFLAFPSDEARKLPSHVSLNVMKTVTIACEEINSH